ncbi:MAG: hypothetical protein AAFS10_06285 [Myxococcota bacterium]
MPNPGTAYVQAFLIVITLLLLTGGIATAEPFDDDGDDGDTSSKPPAVGQKRHDGFFLRLSFGPGWSRATADPELPNQPKLTLTGIHTAGDVAIGGALVEDVVLHATYAWARAREPTLEAGGQEIASIGERFLFNCLGLGTTLYLPLNIYLSGSFGWGMIDIATNEPVEYTVYNLGTSFVLQAGKEWWLTDQWGVGVAGRFLGGRITDSTGNGPQDQVRWVYQHVSVVLSATYN